MTLAAPHLAECLREKKAYGQRYREVGCSVQIVIPHFCYSNYRNQIVNTLEIVRYSKIARCSDLLMTYFQFL